MPRERAHIQLVPSQAVAAHGREEARANAERSGSGGVSGLAFEQLYAQHFEFVWRTLRLLGVEEASLADVCQDVFSIVARQLSSFESRSSLRTWVFGIAQNAASNHRRRRARKLDRLQPLSDTHGGDEPSPEAHAEGKEAADLVVRFCAELEESRRTVFVLGLLEGVPAGEIAALLELPLNTVYSRMHALRQAFKRRLDEREVEQ